MVTRMARDMVTRYGMSSLGPMTFGDKEELVFLGRQLSEQRNYSEETAEQIDAEVSKLVDEAHQLATQILTDNVDKLELLTNALLERETLDAEEFKELLSDKPIPTDSGSSAGGTSAKASSSAQDDADSPPNVVPPSTAPLPA